MLEMIYRALKELPALRSRKSPEKAALIGFLLGGIGLGVYFLSFIDFIFPVAIVMALVLGFNTFAAFGWLGGAVLASVYGYVRARSSNDKLEEVRRSLPVS
jgi:hypothetical protein